MLATQAVDPAARVPVRRRVARASRLRPITGGLLMQEADHIDAPGDDPATWTLQTGDPADAATFRDLAFAWRAIRAVKSNAILLATGGRRSASAWVRSTGSTRPASRSRAPATGPRVSVAASDAFFPFPDGLRGADRGRGDARSSSRAARFATSEVDRGGQGSRASRSTSAEPATSRTRRSATSRHHRRHGRVAL